MSDDSSLEYLSEDGEPLLDAESSGTPAPVEEDVAAPTTVLYSKTQIRRVRDVLARLYAIRRAGRFYPMDHPAVTEGAGDLFAALHEYHAEGVDVHFSFFEGEIIFGEQLLPEESLLFDQLIRDLSSLGISSLVINRGLDERELLRLVEVINADSEELQDAGGIEAVVEAAGLPHIEVGSVRVMQRTGGEMGEESDAAQVTYGGAVSLLREVDRLMRVNRHMSASRVNGVVRSLVDNVVSSRYAMLQLTGLKNYDEYTFYHSANVAILSLALGSMITTDYRFLSSLGVGALLHDIGKLSVDLDILNKPGALTADEWSYMREHPVRGAQMVSQLPGVDKAALVAILEHHMRYDGRGYPDRRPRRSQHIASRIVAVADAYDAMTSRRSYSVARVQDQAMVLLVEGAGSSLDPVLVRMFIRLMGVYPPRSVVRLSEGSVAIVMSPSETDPLKPHVRLIANAAGDFIDEVELDLSQTQEIAIKGCIDPRLLNIDVDAYFKA